MSVHVIDSSRPQNLASLFGAGENGERIIVWDDGGADNMEEERKAWEATMVRHFVGVGVPTDWSMGSTSPNLILTKIRNMTPRRTKTTEVIRMRTRMGMTTMMVPEAPQANDAPLAKATRARANVENSMSKYVPHSQLRYIPHGFSCSFSNTAATTDVSRSTRYLPCTFK
jgi:hypothetical protein